MKKILSLLAISFSLAFAYTEKDFQGWWTFSGKFEPLDPMFVVMATTNEYGTRYISFDILVDLAITTGSYKFLQFEANRKCSSTIINCPGWRFRNNKIEIENSNIQIEIISTKEIDIYQYNQKYTLKKAGTVEQFKKWVNQITQEQAKARKQKEEKEAKEKKEAERKQAEWLASPEYAELQKAEAEKAKQREKYVKDSIEAVDALIKNGLTDSRDSNKYKVVKIGNQIWMAENLNYKTKNSRCYGEESEKDETIVDMEKIKLPNDEIQRICKLLGRLYNWLEATASCPSGWHLPSYDEWNTLEKFAGGYSKAAKKLKAKDFWNVAGTDDYGFSALPAGGGFTKKDGGISFNYLALYGHWWVNYYDDYYKSPTYMNIEDKKIYKGEIPFYSDHEHAKKDDLKSVRCIMD